MLLVLLLHFLHPVLTHFPQKLGMDTHSWVQPLPLLSFFRTTQGYIHFQAAHWLSSGKLIQNWSLKLISQGTPWSGSRACRCWFRWHKIVRWRPYAHKKWCPTNSPAQFVGACNGCVYLSGGGTKNECTLVQDNKSFGYRITSICLGVQRFATPFRRQAMSAEELHDIVSLLHKLYLVLVPIQITTTRINIPNLLVLEACLNGISLAVLGPIYIYFLITVVPYTPCAKIHTTPFSTKNPITITTYFPVPSSGFVIQIISPPVAP